MPYGEMVIEPSVPNPWFKSESYNTTLYVAAPRGSRIDSGINDETLVADTDAPVIGTVATTDAPFEILI